MRSLCLLKIFFIAGLSLQALAETQTMPPIILSDAPVQEITSYLSFYPDSVDAGDPGQIVAQLENRPSRPLVMGDISFKSGQRWAAIRVENPYRHSLSMVLTNSFPIFSLQVISSVSGHSQKVGSTGCGRDASEKVDSFMPAVALEVPPGMTTYYLGFGAEGEPAQLRLWQKTAFVSYNKGYGLSIFAFLGATLALIAFNAFLVVFLRYRPLVYYGIAALFFLGLQAAVAGIMEPMPTAWRVAFAKSWIVWDIALVIALLLFTMAFLNITKKTYPFLHKICLGYLTASPFIVLFWFLGPKSEGFFLLIAANVTVFVVIAVVTAREMLRKNQDAFYYFLSFLPLIVVGSFDALVIYGLFPTDAAHPVLQLSAGIANFMAMSIFIGIKMEKVRYSNEMLRNSLRGVIADAQIETIGEGGIKILRKPVEELVSIMFIDIVGYSMIFQRMGGHDAFYSLKKVLNELTAIVHRYGGVIDKSLGDGILCFFGYDLTGRKTSDHPLQAYRCAVEIQNFTMKNTLKSSAMGLVGEIFPLRIGINTASVYIGNMGDEKRLDITVSGDGVVLASRFEGACEPYKIIIGPTTQEYVQNMQPVVNGLNKILIPVKHQKTLMEVYEYDPFYDRPDEIREARTVFWRQHSIQRSDEREMLIEHMALDTSFGPMNLLNFSLGGFCLDGPIFLGKGALIELKLDHLLERDDLKVISPLLVQVAWSSLSDESRYRHGVKIVGANTAQREMIYNLFKVRLSQSLLGPEMSGAA